jgi:aminoglycoside 3-N-acetyltransferase
VTSGIRERLTAAASTALPSGIKRRLKGLVRAYHQTFHSFTPADLKGALLELGVLPGDVLMVHSAFDRFLAFRGSPVEAIRTLQEVVGVGGTLLMPTIPFRGTAIAYALTDPVFDVQRTVSMMGLITEVFRRSPGVARSIHPTHPVAVWGSRVDAIIAGHEHAETPCGRLTPYGRLLDYDGKILLAGVPANTMTFGYFVAEELEPRLSVRVLTQEKYPLRWRAGDGSVRVSHVRLFSPRLDHDLSLLVSELKRRKQWQEQRVGALRLVLLRAREVFDAAVALADRGTFLRERPMPGAAAAANTASSKTRTAASHRRQSSRRD